MPLGLGGTDRGCSSAGDLLPVVVGSGVLTRSKPAFRVLQVFPNPVNQALTIRLGSLYTGPVTFTVYDANGRRVAHREQAKEGADMTHRMELANLPAGVYRLSVVEGTERSVRTFVKL